jgi:hypothetical protein
LESATGQSVKASFFLKQAVNEWRKSRTLGSYEHSAQGEQEKDHGHKPPFFPLFQKIPELLDGA